MKLASGWVLDRFGALYGVARRRKLERRWYTLWIWRHDESDRRYRARLMASITQQPPLSACLYCGTVCEFGPNCANHDLKPKDNN